MPDVGDRPNILPASELSQDEHGAEATATAETAVSPRTDEHRFRLYTFAVVALGLIAAVAVSSLVPFSVAQDSSNSPSSPSLWLVGGILLVAFVLAEQLSVNVDIRSGVSWTISFTEIPLVVGFFLAPFEVVLIAHLLAGVGALLVRRVTGRLLYNVGTFFWEIAAAFTVAELVRYAVNVTDVAGSTQMPWIAALAGAITAPLVSTLLALGAVRVLRRRMHLGTALRLTARILVLGFVNASVGLSGYLVIVHEPGAWPLVVAVFLGLVGIYWAYSDLLREQRDMEALSDVSLMVARTGQRAAMWSAEDSDGSVESADINEWTVIVERIKDQLAAGRVVLWLRSSATEPMRRVAVGRPLAESVTHIADSLLRPGGAQVRHIRATDTDPHAQEALRQRGAHEALIVPLRSANQLLGVLEAHDRRSRWRGFGKYDVQLLHLMASHLATSLDNRRLLGALRHDAYHDPLTGLLNRVGFRQAAADPLRAHPNTVVVRIDLDVFSAISDALGYAWADRMVVAAGRRIREILGRRVLLARLDGASFAALLVDSSPEHAHATAQRLRTALTAPYPVDRLMVEANAMVGYVSPAAEGFDGAVGDTVDGLLQCADVAVRAAQGGEHVRAYVPSMGQIFLRRFQLVSQFRSALAEGQISVHYQPKVSLPSRHVLGVESLVRWQHPEFGRLNPDEFVAAVEAAGLIGVLTEFVLEQSLQRIRKWLDEGLRIGAAVNLSVRVLADAEFPAKVADALRAFDVPAELLTFELTESGVMSDPQKALPVLRELHNLGVVLAVDDFGTGYSSLAYLRQLPVDQVKIDKSFVLGMGTDLGDLAVVRAIVELGHSLGLTVVAEGVEDDVARDQLEAMGCDVAQGYLISRPLPDDRLEAWLQARTVRSANRYADAVLTLLT